MGYNVISLSCVVPVHDSLSLPLATLLGLQRLRPNYDKLLSSFAFIFNLRRYIKQAYIERNFAPPILFRDIRELDSEQATTAGACTRPLLTSF